MTRLTRRLLTPVLAGAMLIGCVDLDLTNPSQRTADTFFRNRDDAYAAVIASYHGLQELGAFGRWLVFADDMRSDVARSQSPWTDLANFTRTVISSSNFEVNIHLYQHNFSTIGAANQGIARVPAIDMDPTERAAFVGEAKFIRALSYYNLVTLFGNVPLITEPQVAGTLPPAATPAQIWAQIEQDLSDAIDVLPESYDDTQRGRATSWAAKAMLGKAHLQQREWDEAIPYFQDVIDNGPFELLDEFGDNFRADHDNNAESIFEVQFSGEPVLSQGSAGYSAPKLYGPCGPSFCDANPTQWYFDQFFVEAGPDGYDPRLDDTIFWNRPGGMDVFGVPFAERYADRLDALFVKKYTQWYAGRPDEQFDNPVNFKVLRLGGVLLMMAEALNESGDPGAAKPYVDRVRARPSVNLPPLAAGMSQDEMRDAIEHEYLMEMGFEAERFRYLQRQNLLTAAYLPTLRAHDADFDVFVLNRSELLPIPTAETDLNPNVPQNPGW